MLTKLILYVDTVLFTVLPLCGDVHVFGCVTMHYAQFLLTALSSWEVFFNRLNIIIFQFNCFLPVNISFYSKQLLNKYITYK